MPSLIGKFHDKFLYNFSQRGSASKYAAESKILIFGKHSSGFIIPLIKRIKIDSYSDSDFGVCAHFEPVLNVTKQKQIISKIIFIFVYF